ncbi:MAG TPA: Flp pilus assembly protein CpaB [Stellaceae bacterium]|nr:Flp pilus assembly protein CpaB [Stellaceae bacterium]
MRIRSVLLILVAVVLAGGTAMLARAWLAAQRTQVAAEAAPVALPPPVKSVLVAHHAISRGQILKSSDFAWQPWPDSAINKNYILLGTRTPQSFSGWVARHPMTPGEPVTTDKMVMPGSRGFLAAVLRPGMRAVSVPVNATTGISGFVFPGDQVDILITYPVPTIMAPPPGTQPIQHKAAQTILRNIRVIGIDQRLEQKAGEAVIAHTATLEVTPKQSEVIALASEMGKLSLSLRSLAKISAKPGEAAADSSDGPAKPSYTLDSEVSPLLSKPLTRKETPQTDVVTILRGSAKSSESSGAPAAPRGS